MKELPKWDLATRLVHTGAGMDFSGVRTASPPIFQTSNFLYDDVDSGTEILTGKREGYIYGRYGNPTVDALNAAVADMEEGEAALSFGSGLGAISAAVLANCVAGDHIVASKLIYGGTFHFFKEHLARLGIGVTFVDPTNVDELEKSIRENTRILFTEPLANPTLVSSDVFRWAVLAHQHGAKLIVDNTFTPPPIFQPLNAGADLVIHSATKYLGGHSDLLGGVVIGSRKEIDTVLPILKYQGGIIAPGVAWLLLRGLRTLEVRLDRQCDNAESIATYLSEHPRITRVNYPGLPGSPRFEFDRRTFRRFGGMLSFEVEGGFAAAKQVMQGLSLIQFTVSLGDVASLMSHPASTSHIYLTEEERQSIGVTEGLLRLSAGIESANDLINDLDAALSRL